MKTNIEKIHVAHHTVYAAKRGIAPMYMVLCHDWDYSWYEPVMGDVYQALDGTWYIEVPSEIPSDIPHYTLFERASEWAMDHFEPMSKPKKRSRRSRIAWMKAQKMARMKAQKMMCDDLPF